MKKYFSCIFILCLLFFFNISKTFASCSGVCLTNNDAIWTNTDIIYITSKQTKIYAHYYSSCVQLGLDTLIWSRNGINIDTTSLSDTYYNSVGGYYTTPMDILQSGVYQVIFNGYPTQSNQCNVIVVMDSPQTGITTHPCVKVDFTCFPNPSKGKLTIETGEKIPILIITNLIGEKIHVSAINAEKSEIDLRNQPNGIYFLNIKMEKGMLTKKIIINK